MPYTVFKNNNNLITAPNETGEIVLDTSISRQIRIEVYNNAYKFYDIAEKKYLKLSDIEYIDPESCFFTAIIDPCSDTGLAADKVNYPILYKFVDVCLGSTFDHYPIASFNGKNFSSNNICFTHNNTTKLEFVFSDFIDVKIRLTLSPSGSSRTTTFDLTSDDVEIISLFQHNIIINASEDISGTTNYKYIHSLSFSFINNRYEEYDENINGLSTKDKVLSMIRDLPQNKRYPASGLTYRGSYSNGSNTMSIMVYTIEYVNRVGSSGFSVRALYTDKNSAFTSSTTIDSIERSVTPNLMDTLSFIDDVIQLS